MDSEQAGALSPVATPSRIAQWLVPGWKRALRTISMLGAATAAGAVFVFLTQTLLARELGPDAYGLFASSLATVTMIAPLAGFGLTQFRLKIYGVEGWAAARWIKPSLRFTFWTTLASLLIIFGWGLLIAPHDGTRFTVLVLSPVVLSILAIDLLSNLYRLEDRYARMATWQAAIPASRLVVAVALLLVPQLSGRFVAVSYAVIALALVAWAWPELRRMLNGQIDLRGHGPRVDVPVPAHPPRVSELWSQAWAFGLFAVLYPVFFQVSTILLKYLGSDAQAGRWAIALAIMTAIYLIPATIYHKFLLSKLHRWAVHDVPKFWLVYRRGIVGMFLLGIAVSSALVVVSPYAVPLLFGEEYRSVTTILVVLSLCPPIRFLSTAMGAALLTDHHMRYRVYAMAWATVVAVLLNAALIPRYAEIGAAWATVVAEIVLLLGTAYGVRRFHRAKAVSRHRAGRAP
jgi:O-antigen/teichoic acid export membrane protein